MSIQVLDDQVGGYEKAKPARKVKRARKPRTAPQVTPQPAELPTAPPARTSVDRWAGFGVAFTLALSALLNGYANAQHAPLAFAGWVMGISVPVLVLVLSKVAGEKYRSGQRTMSRIAGGSGVTLLLLSVWHCSQSIAILTGSPVVLALPMAVAIDAGLVSCELALITEPRA